MSLSPGELEWFTSPRQIPSISDVAIFQPYFAVAPPGHTAFLNAQPVFPLHFLAPMRINRWQMCARFVSL